MEAVSIAARIAELAAECAADPEPPVVSRHVAADGTETAFTWSELDRRSSQVAAALADRGLGQGDRLGIGLRNSPQLTLSVFAAWKLGAVPVPMRWDLPEWELERLRAVVDGNVHLGEDDIAWIDATAGGPVSDFADVVAPQSHGICSSGSTGLPKVILASRPGVYSPELARPFAEKWGPVARPQTILVLGPMYHLNGFHSFYNLLGGDRVIVLERFDGAQAIDVIERHRVSAFTCTPTMLKRMADVPGIDDRDLSSIKVITQGAAPMPPGLVHRWAGLVGADKLIMSYGMSEGLGITAIRADEWMDKQGSVGRPARDSEVRVLDADGNPAAPGEVGEVYLRSKAYGGSTYLGGAQPTMTDEGFCTVGDLGYLDEDGFLFLVDRRSDLIISGGANIYPAEVETALMDHPKIRDIVIVGLDDEEWGRRVHAIVEPADPADPPSLDDVRAFAKSRLHPFKVPKSMELIDAIPRSAAMKVNRAALTEERRGVTSR
ncbi:MAG TPA: class I adenylate-forming enzyme family protein [Mycobacteriales bacterium]|nr:class I adenylate-forming enzyme family protein [Mycobacteriales bacterium]